MSTGFTDDEIQTAVEALIQNTITRPYDTLGVRRTDLSFTEIQQAAAGVFLLYPKAPFYCLFLGAQQLNVDLVQTEAQTVSDLLAAIQAVGRAVVPVNDVSPLFNAKAALDALGQAALARSTGFKDITTVPAYQQFSSNVDKFVAQNGDAIKSGGQVVQTPQEARAALAGLVGSLSSAHASLLARVKLLSNGSDDYSGLNLSSLVAQAVIANASAVLGAHASELNGLLPADRLTKVRQVILDLLAAKAVVTTYGSFSGAQDSYNLTGVGYPYADATHLANPAVRTASIAGPYNFQSDNNVLLLYLDGASTASATLGLPYAFSPTIYGTRQEQVLSTGTGWFIGDGTHPLRDGVSDPGTPNNNQLIFVINGTTYPVTLTVSADGNEAGTDATPRTADQICSDINAVLNPVGYTAEPYLNPRKYLGYFTEDATGVFTLLGNFGNLGALNVLVGDLMNVQDGDITQQGIWTITAVTSTTVTATNNLGTMPIVQGKTTIEIGSPLRAIKLRALNPRDAVDNLDSISVTYAGSMDASSPTWLGATTLGLGPSGTSTARKQTAKEIATAIGSSSSLITAQAVLVPSSEHLTAHTSATSAGTIVFSKLQAAGDTTWDGTTLTAVLIGTTVGDVVAGDLLVERGGNNIGTLYTVVTASGSTITATGVSGTPSSQSGVTLEMGTIPALSSYELIRINGGPNDGDYYVNTVSGLDVTLLPQTQLPANRDPVSGQPYALDVSVGPEYLQVTGKTTTTQSSIGSGGTASPYLWASTDPTYSTSKYFKLPAKVTNLSVGDLLVLYATQYNVPTAYYNITAIETDILTLSAALPSNVPWTFTPTAPVPFARLQPLHSFDFDAFKVLLDAWAARLENQPAYFTDLNRFINPLIANTSPTGVAVGDALNKVKGLAQYLDQKDSTAYGDGTDSLEEILSLFSVEQQSSVDSLLQAFRDKGADRAVDFLLQGQFQAFFDMDQDDASYAGSLQKASRAVILNDLPQTKTNRKDAKTSKLLSTSTDPDPDYDMSDAENAVPDPPGQGEIST